MFYFQFQSIVCLFFKCCFDFLCSRLSRKAKYNLEKDLKDKFDALTIDEHNAELRNYSAELRFKDGVAKIDAKYVPYSFHITCIQHIFCNIDICDIS